MNDALTGLTDRAGLCRAIDARLGVYDHLSTSLLVASVDRQLYATPETLEDMAKLIGATAGVDGAAARIGRWDFAAVFSVSGYDEAMLVADAMRRAAANPMVVRPGITLSVGVAAADGLAATHARLMDAARWGLIFARRGGGDQVVFSDRARV